MEDLKLVELEAEFWLTELRKRVTKALMERWKLEQILQGKQPVRL